MEEFERQKRLRYVQEGMIAVNYQCSIFVICTRKSNHSRNNLFLPRLEKEAREKFERLEREAIEKAQQDELDRLRKEEEDRIAEEVRKLPKEFNNTHLRGLNRSLIVGHCIKACLA